MTEIDARLREDIHHLGTLLGQTIHHGNGGSCRKSTVAGINDKQDMPGWNLL